jgi:hypothetical protein
MIEELLEVVDTGFQTQDWKAVIRALEGIPQEEHQVDFLLGALVITRPLRGILVERTAMAQRVYKVLCSKRGVERANRYIAGLL